MSATADFKDTEQLLVHLLTDLGILDSKKLEILREAQTRDNASTEHLLIKKELATERDIARAYTRYLANVYRKKFDLFATPVVVEYRTDKNPYLRERRVETHRHPKPSRRGKNNRRN